MVAIPTSPGPRIAPQAGPTSVAPINPTAVSNAVQELGNTGVQVAAQRIQFETRRNEALQTAKSIDYSTQIKQIDNDLELQAQQVPSTPKAFQGMSQRLGAERQKKIDELLGGEQDDVVRGLTKRNAEVLGVDFSNRLNRYQLSKESEYGKHVITSKLDGIGEELSRTSDPQRLSELNKEINTTLSAGIQSRYIDYNFIENYQDQVKKITAKREAEVAQTLALNSYLDGTSFADPNNAKDKAMINSAFDRMIKSNDPNLQAQAIELSARTGIVPAQLVSSVSGRLTVGTTQQKVQAAQIVSQLITKNPRLVSSFPETIQSQAISINRSIEAGIPADQAVEYAEKNLPQNKSFDRDRREQTFQMDNKQKLREKNIADLKDSLSDIPYSFKTAEVPEAVVGQYEYLTKQFYMNSNLSYEDATAQAAAVIKSQWKMTDIGGTKKLQRYSPESQYHIEGVSDKWIKNQVLDTLAGEPDIEANPEGLIEKGNIDLSKRILLKNKDGTASSLRAIPIEDKGRIVLIPTIQNGEIMSEAQAENFYKKTGQNLGTFDNVEDASKYADRIAKFENQRFKGGAKAATSLDQINSQVLLLTDLKKGEGRFVADKLERPNYFPNTTKEEINQEIELAVDPSSIASGRPSYFISRTVDEYGRKELILDEANQPLHFTPDFSQTEEYKSSQLAREALRVSPEEFAQRLYEKRKSREELTPANARAVSLIGGEAFK